MVTMQAGDIVIRGITESGFLLFEASSLTPVAGPFQYFRTAVAAARVRRPHAIWQQSVDHRGRLLGDPFPVPLRQEHTKRDATTWVSLEMSDRALPLNCPQCGKPLAYTHTSSETLFYRCERDGTVILPPDGRVRVDDPNHSAVRK